MGDDANGLPSHEYRAEDTAGLSIPQWEALKQKLAREGWMWEPDYVVFSRRTPSPPVPPVADH